MATNEFAILAVLFSPPLPMKSRLSQPHVWSNWSGAVRCEPNHCAEPLTIEEIQAEVVRAGDEGQRLRVIGGGGSFSPLCATDDNHMSLRRFSGIEAVDVQRSRVWLRAGTSLRRVHALLADRELALENAPSYDRATIAGAISTASHGSGLAFGNLSSLVTGLRLVLADGSRRTCSREHQPELFDAARVSLGALGVITHVELQCVDHYRLRVQSKRATFGETLMRLTELRREHRNFEIHWSPYANIVRQRYADEVRAAASRSLTLHAARTLFHEQIVLRGLHLLARRSAHAAEKAGRLLADSIPSDSSIRNAEHAYRIVRRTRVQHLEYALPVEAAHDTLRRLERLLEHSPSRVHVPIEVRFVRGDDAWLSPHYQRDSVCITVPAYRDVPHADYYAALTALFGAAGGRPAWSSAHTLAAAELRPRYPRFDDFLALRAELDPLGLFLNPHLGRIFGAALR
jgi:FAD-linked oxidoreductase